MPQEDRLDVATAAERHNCSTKTIWRRIKDGTLPARTEKVDGRDGRPVLKTLIRVVDLDDTFEGAVQEDHVRRIRASAPPLTVEQKIVIRDVFLEHLLEREAKRNSAETEGVPA